MGILAPSELRDYLGDLRQGFAMSTACGFTLIPAGCFETAFQGGNRCCDQVLRVI